MSVRNSLTSTFGDPIAHEAMMAGWHWAQRNHWLFQARHREEFMRKSHVENARDEHRKMMAHLRAAKAAGAK